MRRARRRHVQLTLDQARKPDGRHGGWRPGAGRPTKPAAISHDTRPDEPARFPQHVTMRIAEGVPSLARAGIVKLIRAAIRDSHKPDAAAMARSAPARREPGREPTRGERDREPARRDPGREPTRGERDREPARREPGREPTRGERDREPARREPGREPTRGARGREPTRGARRRKPARGERGGGFRIVEFNVLGNHIHLLTEADGKAALASGIAGFEVRVAQRVNARFGRRGKVFPQRYHARALKTPREVRNVLAYVLLNRKHHAAEQRFTRAWIDPASSAAWFAGWAQPVRGDEPWKRELLALPQPTAPPRTWLLAAGWKRHGLLRFDERPA